MNECDGDRPTDLACVRVNLCTQVFINGTLAIDLGGAHQKDSATVQLNKTDAPTLKTPWNKNLTIGRTYGRALLRRCCALR
jgi:hypothetical protein